MPERDRPMGDQMAPTQFMLILVGTLLLAGCVSTGTKVTEQQAGQFERGVTTREQVVKKLGSPNSSTALNDGSRIDVYVHIEAAANAASYIPVVGLLAGGATSTSNTATFTYDGKGLLKAINTSQGQSNANTGLLNQK